MEDFTSHNAVLRVSTEESQWKTLDAQDKMLQWSDFTEAKGRHGERDAAAHMTALQQREQTDSNICPFSLETGDWQAAATFIRHTDTEKKHLTQTPNRLRNVSFLTRTRALFFVLVNCAQIKIIPSWWDAKLTAYLSSLPGAAKSCICFLFFSI